MEITVRAATAADHATVTALGALLTAEVSPLRGGTLHLAEQRMLVDAALGHLDPLPDTESPGVLVGEIDGEVVGAMVLRLAVHDGLRVGVIDAFGVLAEARGVGVGEALVTHAVERFRALECVGVDASALPGARETKNFFEQHGFTARRLVVHHRFDT